MKKGNIEETTQEERHNHLLSLGFTEDQVREAEQSGPLPAVIMLLSRRPLSEEEKEYGKTLTRSRL